MAKFNLKKQRSRQTINHMGAKAYQYDERFELVSNMLTTFAEDSYYRSSQEGVERLVQLISKIKDKNFVAKAVLFARKEFHMRSVSHIMAAELAPYLSGTEYARDFYEKMVVRPDDMLETVAYYKAKVNKAIPNAMKKGFAKAFDKFDGYQLAKYRGENKAVKLVDLVNIIHPVPTQKNATALQQLVDGQLRNTDTWEARLTDAGSENTAKKEAWEDLILSKKLGYMALLRNLRNILKADVSEEAFAAAMRYLSDPVAVARSRQLPFRFLSAYQEIQKLDEEIDPRWLVFEKDATNRKRQKTIMKAIEKAINHSIENLPLLEGETVILSDNSGSMRGDRGGSSALSAMSKRTTADIANLFATMYWSRCNNTLIGLFGDRLILPKLNRHHGLFTNFNLVHSKGGKCGPGTEAGIFTMFERLIEEKRQVARIVIFSDMQIGKGCSWYDTKGRRGSDFNKLYETYRSINPSVRVYSVDLRGYGTTVFKDNVYKMAGWSEKIFKIMEMVEQDPNALISRIEEIRL